MDLADLLAEMADVEASDLFLAEGRPPAWRLHGSVAVTLHPPTTRADLDAFAARWLLPTQRDSFERTGDLDAAFAHPTLGRFRLHLHRQRGLIGAVVRRIQGGALAFDTLGLPDAVRGLAEAPRGLVLIAGATGSGKSTTLAAMVHHINASASKHIVTLEDPIEFVHDDLLSIVTQREVGTDARDFASALRHAVRQSPDVLVIGEMRDAETAAVAISAALTGHLVLSSIHTIDATQTLQRVLGWFPERMRAQISVDLSMCVQGVIAQRLVPRPDDAGRAAAVEVLLATPAVRRLIREQRVEELPDVMNASPGMQSFDRALVRLWSNGEIARETGAAYATHPDTFHLAAQGLERGSRLVVADHDEAATLPSDMRALLDVALAAGASDLHLVVGEPPMLRVDGRLAPAPGHARLTAGIVRRLLFSVLNPAQRERFDLERELDLALTFVDGRRFRMNAHVQRGTAAVAIRLIPQTIPDPAALRMPTALLDLSMRSQGLILVTGPTGSGKSTTLAALVDHVNAARRCHIVTIEDPIEFVHADRLALVEQRELGQDTLSFAAALRHVLRQDPDVILVGEMRDTDTIAAALTAAETGHLVLATLHSNDAPTAIDRIVDVFPAHQQAQVRVQLAAELLAVVAQRLLPAAQGSGRVAAFELMVGTPAVRTLVREGKIHLLPSAIETAARDGMITLDRAIADLVRAGAVKLEDAAPYVRNQSALREQARPGPRTPGA